MTPPAVKEYFRNLNQKRSIRAVSALAIMMAMPVFGAYGYFFAVKSIRVDRVKLKLSDRFPALKGLKIAQISDLHYGPSNSDSRFFNRAVDLIIDHKPDLIVLTGDYYQWDPEYLHGLPKLLSRLKAPLGVFGVFGNHDYGACYPGTQDCDPFDHKDLRESFARRDILLLGNENVTLDYNGQALQLVGMHDLWSGFFNPDEAFQNTNSDLPTILLSHNPDTAAMVPHEFDLMMAGHVHGGQVSFPIFGPISVPVKNRKFRRGLHELSARKRLYVNRGLGFNFKLRMNSPPEVTILEVV